VKPDAENQAITDLMWLGLDWDERVPNQLSDMRPYEDALHHLRAAGLVYECRCTRKEIRLAQSAPHLEDHEMRYPGTCRPTEPKAPAGGDFSDDSATACRVRAPDRPISFVDRVHGEQTFDVDAQVGDFVVANKAGVPAYQLAVVVDDARQGVTDVVRGDDLLTSAARQLWLYRLLGLSPEPTYWHLPLILGYDGHRLAKRHGDTRLAYYRDKGVAVERIIGLLACWSGLADAPREMDARTFLQRFDPDRLPTRQTTMTREIETWLTTS